MYFTSLPMFSFDDYLFPGMADLLLVNSRFTASTFARTFRHLHSKGFEPAVLYPAVNVEQFNGPFTFR